MADFKDLFSQKAQDYARYRPGYPVPLFDWLASKAPGRELAIDLGCGNGQSASALSDRFEQVIGVDPSRAQLENAISARNIRYVCAAAEDTGLPAGAADVATVAQAFHWFRRPQVYGEIKRLLKPGGLLVIWCYNLNHVNDAVDAVVRRLYHDHLDAYWEPERRLVENGYKDLKMPFNEVAVPEFQMQETWELAQLIGYLNTWSPLKRFKTERGFDALEDIVPALKEAWAGEEKRLVSFPLRVRAFKI